MPIYTFTYLGVPQETFHYRLVGPLALADWRCALLLIVVTAMRAVWVLEQPFSSIIMLHEILEGLGMRETWIVSNLFNIP